MRYLQTLLIFMFWINFQAQAKNKLDHNALAGNFVEVLNSKDLSQIEQFVVNNFSPNSLSRWQGTGKARYVGYSINKALFHGKLTVISAELKRSDSRIRHVSKLHSENTDMQQEMVIFFNNDHKQAITGWYISEDPHNNEENDILTESQFIEEVKAYTTKLALNGAFSGTVLLAKNEKLLFSAAHGLASHRFDVKNNLDTKFQIGSMNKMFTSVAIMQLVEAGKLSLNDSLTKFVEKKYLGKGEFKNVKIKHLLSLTSGVGEIVGYEQIQHKVRSLKDIQHLYTSIDLTFEPGSQWRYSNTGMILLGEVIEFVTGENYYDYINKNIYQKAGMAHSGSFDLDVPVKNTARNYWFSV